MNLYRFRVVFGNGPDITVTAGGEKTAVILAQAQRIKMAMTYLNIVNVIKLGEGAR